MKRIPIILLLAMLIVSTLSLSAQEVSYPATTAKTQFLGKSRPLTELKKDITYKASKEKARKAVPKGVPNFTDKHSMPSPFADQAHPKYGDPLVQNTHNQTLQVFPEVVFDGLDESRTNGVFPPDPNGVIGNDYYMQVTNTIGGTQMVIFDLLGNEVFSFANLNDLWTEFNAMGLGDPVVLWDHGASRWVLTEFQDFSSSALLIAISESSDPTGSWYVYRFETPTFPDYPKYGIWHNAYLVTTNEFGEDDPVYALDRQAMLNGEDADMLTFGIPKFVDTDAFQVATPITWDGFNAPSEDSPAYAVRMYDDAWGGGQDKIELWELDINWDDPDGSSITGPFEFFTTPFESDLCNGGDIFNCISQPNGQTVSALQHVIMHRAPYNRFSGHESIALQFSVDVDGNDRAGIRWMELRRSGNEAWQLYQEGTHAPDDAHNRFMGSLALDHKGNMLLAYTLGGPEKEFSLAYTGRLANDPLGVLTIDEYEFATGLSSSNNQRWGDYSAMTVSPQNGTDFWFTGEYMKADQWGTKIMSTRITRDSNDVGPQAIITPQNSGYLTDAEVVEVAVRNYGYKPQHDIGISYTVNGGNPVNEIITDTIQPDSTYYHTFGTTADLETIGAYDFKIYTTLASDTLFFNDTLTRTVYQLPRNDVAAHNIDGINPIICDSILTIEVGIRNAGVDTLYSAAISIQLNADTPIESEWEGALPPGGIEYITVTIGPFLEGANTLTVTTSLPNGVPDEEPNNDSRSTNFETVFNTEGITMLLTTDTWPSETTWELSDESGTVLLEGGPYADEVTTYEHNWCLPEACYTLTINDAYGDGMVGPPPGNILIQDEEGNILANLDGADNFGTQAVLDFCSGFVCMLEASAEIVPESAPGANDGRIIFSLENGVPNYSYSIDGGQNFQASPVFLNLPAGTYDLVALDGNQCEATLTVEVITCALNISAEILNATEGQADGSVAIFVDGGLAPYTYSIDGNNFQISNVFSNLPAGDYTVIIRDEQGCETTYEVEIGTTSDVGAPIHTGISVKLFPNPTEHFVRIEIEGLALSTSLPIKVFDAGGKVIRRHNIGKFGSMHKGILSLHDLPNGTYYLRFIDNELPYLHTVIKQ